MRNSSGLVVGNSSFSSANTCHLRYFLISVKSLQLCAVSLAQMGLWNDKALQDVFSKSALTPPIAFYGPEGEGAFEATDAATVTNWVVCLWTHWCAWMTVGVRGVCVCKQHLGGKRLLSFRLYIKTQACLFGFACSVMCEWKSAVLTDAVAFQSRWRLITAPWQIRQEKGNFVLTNRCSFSFGQRWIVLWAVAEGKWCVRPLLWCTALN